VLYQAELTALVIGLRRSEVFKRVLAQNRLMFKSAGSAISVYLAANALKGRLSPVEFKGKDDFLRWLSKFSDVVESEKDAVPVKAADIVLRDACSKYIDVWRQEHTRLSKAREVYGVYAETAKSAKDWLRHIDSECLEPPSKLLELLQTVEQQYADYVWVEQASIAYGDLLRKISYAQLGALVDATAGRKTVLQETFTVEGMFVVDFLQTVRLALLALEQSHAVIDTSLAEIENHVTRRASEFNDFLQRMQLQILQYTRDLSVIGGKSVEHTSYIDRELAKVKELIQVILRRFSRTAYVAATSKLFTAAFDRGDQNSMYVVAQYMQARNLLWHEYAVVPKERSSHMLLVHGITAAPALRDERTAKLPPEQYVARVLEVLQTGLRTSRQYSTPYNQVFFYDFAESGTSNFGLINLAFVPKDYCVFKAPGNNAYQAYGIFAPEAVKAQFEVLIDMTRYDKEAHTYVDSNRVAMPDYAQQVKELLTKHNIAYKEV
jgi:hypothetical protein